jgi:Divergent InlB B-repeat domain
MRTRNWCAAAAAALTLMGCEKVVGVFNQVEVRVSGAGTGSGLVYSTERDVRVGCRIVAGVGTKQNGECTSVFRDAGGGGVFALTARPDEGSTFGGWTGCNEVAGLQCTLRFPAESAYFLFAVTATFESARGPELGVNVLQNGGFELPVVVGDLPTNPGLWQGDTARSELLGAAARGGTRALQFIGTSRVASASGVSSQQWQIVDVSGLAAPIDSGRIRATGEAWFLRQDLEELGDDRFDLRLEAFRGTPAEFPASYAAPTGVRLADEVTTVIAPARQWVRAQRTFTVPPGTRYLVVEIYAFENRVNDATLPEFPAHYADDVSLVLTRVP